MPDKRKVPPSPLVAAAAAFDDTLQRFASLAEALRKGALDSQRNLERAGEALKEVAACEQELQAQAQALMAALGASRDAQQTQAEIVRSRADDIEKRAHAYADLMRRFEALGKDAAALNTTAQELAGRKRTADEMVRDGELLAGIDELGERMTSVATNSETLAGDARRADFEDLSRKIDSLRQQILAARNKIGLLKDALVRASPPTRAS
jgi:hypothetical protein